MKTNLLISIALALLSWASSVPAQTNFVSGHITNNTAWTDPAVTYALNGSLYVDAGATLTLGPGVKLLDNGTSYHLYVNGTLFANGAAFIGNYQSVNVNSNGQANLVGCSIPGSSSYITFAANSSGRLESVTGAGGWDLTISGTDIVVTNTLVNQVTLNTPVTVLASAIGSLTLNASAVVSNCGIDSITLSGGTPVVTGCRLTNATPLTITDPDVLTVGFSNNTYLAGSPWVGIYGTLDGTRVLGPVENLWRYKQVGDLILNGTLTVLPGIELYNAAGTSADMIINGTLAASGARFTGTYMQIVVNTGGRADLVDCLMEGTTSYAQYSHGLLDRVSGKFNLTVYGGAFANIAGNDFSQVKVTSTGDAGQPLDLRYNWWGTNSAAGIEAKITHKVDSPSRPLVVFQPWLTAAPSPSGVQAWLDSSRVVLPAGEAATVPVVVYSGFAAADFGLLLDYPAGHVEGVTWTNLAANIASGSAQSTSPTASYALLSAFTNQPIQGVQKPGGLRIFTVATQSTALIRFAISSATATNAEGTFFATGPGTDVELLILGSEPYLEAIRSANGQRSLQLFGNPGASYTIEVNTNLAAVTAWFPVVQHYLLTNQTQVILLPGDSSPATCYRAFRE